MTFIQSNGCKDIDLILNKYGDGLYDELSALVLYTVQQFKTNLQGPSELFHSQHNSLYRLQMFSLIPSLSGNHHSLLNIVRMVSFYVFRNKLVLLLLINEWKMKL